MGTIAKRATALFLVLAALIAFTPAESFAAPTNGWDDEHVHYYVDGYMAESCWMYIEEDGAWYYFLADGTVKKGWIGEDEYWHYADPSTGKCVTGWKKINGYWYYFDPSEDFDEGLMYCNGLSWIGGKYYYFATMDDGTKKLGKMQYGWIKGKNYDGDSVWYYANPSSGVITTGWKKVDGKWYYFEPSDYETYYGGKYYYYGEMHKDGVEVIKGNPYYFAKGGSLQSGWIKEPHKSTWDEGVYMLWNKWFYADPNNDSRLVTGWKKISGYWYYFGVDYVMYDNDTWRIDGKLYVFSKNGKLPNKAGWVDLSEEYTLSDGTTMKDPWWAYSNSSGIATVGWKKISGYWYYFGEWGYMEHDTWFDDSKGSCYLQSNGKMATSKWVKYSGEWYYVDASGHMVKDCTITINGKTYSFDEDGIWLP